MKKLFLILFISGLAFIVAGCAGTATPAPTTAAPTATPAGAVPVTGATSTPGATPSTSAATPSTGGVVQIQFWHGQSQVQQTALNKLVDEFNSTHPNIHVTATYQGTYNDLFKKVQAAISACTPPDLAIAYQDDVANYVKSGAVIPLDD